MKPFSEKNMDTVDKAKPLLSIIIPVLNEQEQLPGLLTCLGQQKMPACELIIADGGSKDGGIDWLRERLADFSFPLHLIRSTPGRGLQLNQAVVQARGEWLLFLHADSRFADPRAIQDAIDNLQSTGSQTVAGHFSLKFRREDESPSYGYYYYEWKARLGRPETIHGDQGFLLRRSFFQQVGSFREDLPVMEDTDFAERLRRCGNWLLLPAEISTSARRFEQEGLWQRQLLNSIIMCLREIDYEKFFHAAPEVYRRQEPGALLKVRPFFVLIRQLFAEHSWRERWRIWWRSGCYVRNHAWQLTFARDARRAFRQGIPVGHGRARLTKNFEPVYDLLTDHPPGRLLATLLLRLWFEVTDLWLRRGEKNVH